MEEGRSLRTGTITSVDQTTVDIQVAGSPRSILDVAIVGGTSNVAVGDKVLLYRTGAEVYAMSAGRGGGYFSSSCGSTCTAGGLTPQILYNDGGVCAGDQNLEWDEDNAAIVLNSIGMDPAISYINFGGTPGSSGYGFRVSSSGNMQFKNSGDSWTDIGSAVGSASPAGSDTEIQFNDSSSFGASSQLTWHVSEGTHVALHINPDETDNEYGYINLGDDVGSSGMGFRVTDTGELQYKEYGGSWSDFSGITSGAWLVGGNSPGADSILGTLDNYAIDITVNNETALRIEPQVDSPNIIGGYSDNSVSGKGCVVCGGGSSGNLNVISNSSLYSVISGGSDNEIEKANYSGVLSGSHNLIGASDDTGLGNVICGGTQHEIGYGAWYSAILYGAANEVGDDVNYSVASGRNAQASNDGVFIWADSTNAVFQSESDNEFAVRAQGGARFITDVSGTTINGGIVIDWLSTSGAGSSSGLPDEVNVIKTATDDTGDTLELIVGSHRAMHVVDSSMGPAITLGHEDNTIGSTGSDIYGSVILGGGGQISSWANTIIDSKLSTIAGGCINHINDADAAFIGGGVENTVSADYSAAMGREATASHEGVFIWGDSTGEEFTSVTSKEFAVRAQNGLRVAYDNDNYFVVEPGSGGNIDFDITGEGASPAFSFNDDLDVWGTFVVQNGYPGVFTGETRWQDGLSYFGLQAAVSSDNTTYTWPSSDGAANQVLSTDGSGILQWISSSGVGSASDFVAGSDTEIQYNDGNDFGASSDLTWDDINSALTVNGSVSLDDNNEVRFYDDGANYVGFEAPALSADQIWVLPDSDGSADQFLQTDGSGNLSWASGINGGDIDLDGNDLIIDEDGDSYLHASADDVVDLVLATIDGEFTVSVGGGDVFTFAYPELECHDSNVVGVGDLKLGNNNTQNITYILAEGRDYSGVYLKSYDNSTSNSFISFYRSRGEDIENPTVVQDGDSLGDLTFIGYDGSTDRSAANIGAEIDGTPGDEDMPGRLIFSTTRDGEGIYTEAMRLSSEGGMYLTEITSADDDIAGKGQIWVKDDDPNTLWFTDGGGTDHQLGGGGGGTDLTGLGTDNTIARWNGTDTLQDSEITIDDSGNIAIPDGNKLIFGTGSDVEIYWDDAGSDLEITSTSGDIQIDMTVWIDDFLSVNKLESDTEVIIGQQSSCGEFDPDSGALWVKDDDPTTLWFTDDDGTDHQLGVGSTTGTIVLLASSGWPSTTNGCADPIRRELVTNDVDIYTAAFDKDSDEYMQWSMVMPDDYDGGTITAAFHWTTQSGGAAETVEWALQGVAFADDGALDASWGTAQTVSDTWIADDDLHITSDTSAITLAGSPAGGQLVQFRAYRDVSADDLGGDAELIAVKVEYTRS